MADTILVSGLMATLAAIVAGLAAAAPAVGARDRFFGVLVGSEFASGPAARQTLRVYRIVTLGAGVVAVAALLLPVFGASPAIVSPVFFLFATALIGAYLWAHHRTLEQAKKTPSAPAAEADARKWKLGIIYFDPSDPRIDVPKNFGSGSTLNFARGTSWFIILLPIFFAALIFTVVALVT